MQSGWRPQTAATYSLSEKARFGKDFFCFFLPLNASKRLFPPLPVYFVPLRHIVKRNPSCKEVV